MDRANMEIIANGCAISPSPGDHCVCTRSSQKVQEQQSHEEQEERDWLCKISAPLLEFTKVPSSLMEKEFKNQHIGEDDEGFKTPTSSDHKIPATLTCPRAPRKRRPAVSMKPRARPSLRPLLITDASIDIESLITFRNQVNQRSADTSKVKPGDRPERFIADAYIKMESLFGPGNLVNQWSAEIPRKLSKKAKRNEP